MGTRWRRMRRESKVGQRGARARRRELRAARRTLDALAGEALIRYRYDAANRTVTASRVAP